MDNNILDLFGGKQSSGVDVLKDFLNKDDIALKTDVNNEKVKILCQINWSDALKKEENKDMSGLQIIQKETIPYYLQLRCSVNRQSRKEILDTLSKMDEKFIIEEKGMMPNLK